MSNKTINNEEILIKKQELLKSEIVDKKYDGNKFLQFCLDKKENGDDMNNWTYDELKQCVKDFIEGQKPKPILKCFSPKNSFNKKNSQNNIEAQNNDTEKLDENEADKGKKKDSQKVMPKGDYCFDSKIHELTCKILEKSFLNNKEIKVTVKNPKSEKGKLSQNYVSYEVCTEPSFWTVRRRYSDFIILRQILCKYYPRMLIPPLPEKKIGNKRFKQDFIEKRMYFLQIFIDGIVKNETLKANEAVTVFLNFNDHTTFEKKMKELNNYTPPQNFDETKTLTGKINVLENDYEVNQFLTSINYFCKTQKQIFHKLNNALKNYCRNIAAACLNLEEISKRFEELDIAKESLEIQK